MTLRASMDSSKLQTESQKLKIANGATDSTVMGSSGYALGSIQLPGAMTGATVKFQISNDGSNFQDVASGQVLSHESESITASANAMAWIPSICLAAKFWRVVSASAEGAEREIIALMKS